MVPVGSGTDKSAGVLAGLADPLRGALAEQSDLRTPWFLSSALQTSPLLQHRGCPSRGPFLGLPPPASWQSGRLTQELLMRREGPS